MEPLNQSIFLLMRKKGGRKREKRGRGGYFQLLLIINFFFSGENRLLAAERNILAEEMLCKENYTGALGLLDDVVMVCVSVVKKGT